ncbi:MAG: hypothetical protein ABIB43_05990 [archaeon]
MSVNQEKELQEFADYFFNAIVDRTQQVTGIERDFRVPEVHVGKLITDEETREYYCSENKNIELDKMLENKEIGSMFGGFYSYKNNGILLNPHDDNKDLLYPALAHEVIHAYRAHVTKRVNHYGSDSTYFEMKNLAQVVFTLYERNVEEFMAEMETIIREDLCFDHPVYSKIKTWEKINLTESSYVKDVVGKREPDKGLHPYDVMKIAYINNRDSLAINWPHILIMRPKDFFDKYFDPIIIKYTHKKNGT